MMKWLLLIAGGLSVCCGGKPTPSPNSHAKDSTSTAKSCNKPVGTGQLDNRALGIDIKGSMTLTDKYPNEFPADFPVYSQATVVGFMTAEDAPGPRGAVGKLLTVLTCTTDDLGKVKQYFKSITLAANGWESDAEGLAKESAKGSPEVQREMQKALDALPSMTFVKGASSSATENSLKNRPNTMGVITETSAAANTTTEITYLFWVAS
jgi:hypothetical protein